MIPNPAGRKITALRGVHGRDAEIILCLPKLHVPYIRSTPGGAESEY
jgi:hypothetical protein